MMNESGFFLNSSVIPFHFSQTPYYFFPYCQLPVYRALNRPTGTKGYKEELNKHFKIIALIACGIKKIGTVLFREHMSTQKNFNVAIIISSV